MSNWGRELAGTAFVALAIGQATTAVSQTNSAERCTALSQLTGAALGEPSAHIVTSKLNAR